MEKIAVQIASGFEEIEAISIIDVLRRAEFEVVVVSTTGSIEVTGSHNITIKTDALFETINYAEIDMIVLPGGMPGANNLKNHKKLQDQILDFHANGKPLGAICAAPLVLGSLGVLKNKKATCYPGFEDQLTGATVTGKNVEISDKVITGKGAGVAIEFALGVVELLQGADKANELAAKMVLPKR